MDHQAQVVGSEGLSRAVALGQRTPCPLERVAHSTGTEEKLLAPSPGRA
jgi:hypothetical protein